MLVNCLVLFEKLIFLCLFSLLIHVNPNLGGFFRGSFWGGEGVGVVKLVRIMLETWNLVCKYAHLWSFRKYFFSTKTFLILLMLAVFCKKTAFLGKNSTFTQRNSARTVLEIKGNKNVRFTDYASRIFRIAPN